jgi:hypothetical protein
MCLPREAQVGVGEVLRVAAAVAGDVGEAFDGARRRNADALLLVDEVVDVVAQVDHRVAVTALGDTAVGVEPAAVQAAAARHGEAQVRRGAGGRGAHPHR